MASLEARIARLESERPTENLLDIVLRNFPPLGTNGAIDWNSDHPAIKTFAPFFAEHGAKSVRFAGQFANAAYAGLAESLELFHDPRNPFALERHRSKVPAPILAAVYGTWRNYAFPPDVRKRVHQLAGILDADGNLTPVTCSPRPDAFPDPQGHA